MVWENNNEKKFIILLKIFIYIYIILGKLQNLNGKKIIFKILLAAKNNCQFKKYFK